MEDDEYDMPISNPLPPPPKKQRNEKCGRRSGLENLSVHCSISGRW